LLAIGLPGRLLIVLAVALLLTVALLIARALLVAGGRIELTSLILRLLLAWEVLLGVLAARLVAAGGRRLYRGTRPIWRVASSAGLDQLRVSLLSP